MVARRNPIRFVLYSSGRLIAGDDLLVGTTPPTLGLDCIVSCLTYRRVVTSFLMNGYKQPSMKLLLFYSIGGAVDRVRRRYFEVDRNYQLTT
jgi:hypothetical protein